MTTYRERTAKDKATASRSMRRVSERPEGDPRYIDSGNNVYARQRKLGKKRSAAYVQDTVSENEGSDTKVYVRTKYPNGIIRAATYPHDKKNQAYISGRPGVLNTAKNSVRDRNTVVHEHQHVKDFAGNNKLANIYDESAKEAASRADQSLDDNMGLSGKVRYSNGVVQRRGYYEGRADSAAEKKTGYPSHMAGGYPSYAQQNPQFGSGYVKGGGRLQAEYSHADRKRGRAVVREERKRMKEVKKSADFELGPRLGAIKLSGSQCILWQGAMRNGYGVKKIPGKGDNSTINAHRYVYEKTTGKKIPPGMAIDHTCRNRRCINPKHMEVVSYSENKSRAWKAQRKEYKHKNYKGEVEKMYTLSKSDNKDSAKAGVATAAGAGVGLGGYLGTGYGLKRVADSQRKKAKWTDEQKLAMRNYNNTRKYYDKDYFRHYPKGVPGSGIQRKLGWAYQGKTGRIGVQGAAAGAGALGGYALYSTTRKKRDEKIKKNAQSMIRKDFDPAATRSKLQAALAGTTNAKKRATLQKQIDKMTELIETGEKRVSNTTKPKDRFNGPVRKPTSAKPLLARKSTLTAPAALVVGAGASGYGYQKFRNR